MKYDLIIIGAGPAGYIAAIRAGQVGLKTAIIEKSKIGGMSLNWGFLNTKTFLESAKYFNKIKNSAKFGIDGVDTEKLSFNWDTVKQRAADISSHLVSGVEHNLQSKGVDVIFGEAKIISEKSVSVDNRLLETKNIIIATGSYPKKLDLKIDQKKILEIENLNHEKEIPQNIVVAGIGGIAIEIAQFFNLIGKTVSILVTQDDLLPGFDEYIKKFIQYKLTELRIELIFHKDVKGFENGELIFNGRKIKCDKIINCSWRSAILPESKIEIDLMEKGTIKVNEFLQTNFSNIYAVGDVNGLSYLSQAASIEGLQAVNHIMGINDSASLKKAPLNIYSYPEIAQVGLTEQDLILTELDYKIAVFPMTSNAKALIEGNSEGVMRIIYEKKYGEILGVQIISEHATDMISEAQAFLSVESTIYDVAKVIHSHPTISEVFMESGFDAFETSFYK